MKWTKRAGALAIVLGIVISIPSWALAMFKEVPYTYAGNFKGWLNSPDTPGKKPVIIYVYDQFYDWAGHDLAIRQGYDLRRIMSEFEGWGFISFVPIEKYRKAHAVSGAVHYLKTRPDVDPSQIHIVGVGEGASVALLGMARFDDIASFVLLSPHPINDTGYFSFPNLLRLIDKIDNRMLFIFAAKEKKWRIRFKRRLRRIFKENSKQVDILYYPVSRQWFWSPYNRYMQDIHLFITGKPIPIPKELQ